LVVVVVVAVISPTPMAIAHEGRAIPRRVWSDRVMRGAFRRQGNAHPRDACSHLANASALPLDTCTHLRDRSRSIAGWVGEYAGSLRASR
jgi:hypothetical protein